MLINSLITSSSLSIVGTVHMHWRDMYIVDHLNPLTLLHNILTLIFTLEDFAACIQFSLLTILAAHDCTNNKIPWYSRKIWRFGGLPCDRQIKNLPIPYTCIYTYGDPLPNHQIKIRQCFYNGDLGPNRQIYFPPIFPAIRYMEKCDFHGFNCYGSTPVCWQQKQKISPICVSLLHKLRLSPWISACVYMYMYTLVNHCV